jgi:DNA-binding response OmpR family regulator
LTTLTARRICVIDDDASLRKLCQTILTAEGFEVDLLVDLATAADYVARTQPDLVMMDLRLGQEVDGVQILMGLKAKDSTTAGIPVLVCSAARDMVNSHRQLLDELDCFTLEKPFNIEALLTAIDLCLSAVSK